MVTRSKQDRGREKERKKDKVKRSAHEARVFSVIPFDYSCTVDKINMNWHWADESPSAKLRKKNTPQSNNQTVYC